MNNLFNYIDRPSPIHNLTGATKFICLMLISFAAMSTYDTRMLVLLSLAGVVLLKISRIKWKDISFVMKFTLAFLAINTVLVYIFAPQHGVGIYGSCTYVWKEGYYYPTYEQLFYHLNYILKYFATIPIILLFVCTTNPSEFASSLNKIGVKYTVAYSVALALRYIPDIQREYYEISKAQQARGIEMTRKAPLLKRIKAVSSILVPLVLTGMDKVEIVSNAMELRSFGKNKKRTWYMGRDFKAGDFLAMAVSALMVVIAFYLNHINGSRFYNPFI